MLKLAKLFGDNAVLQRGRTIAVWGWCEPYRMVRGTLGAAVSAARSGADGRFTLRFAPMEAAEKLELRVTAKESGEEAVSHNLAIGEVWIASGQSNMEFLVPGLADGGAEVRKRAAAGDFDKIRMLTVPRCAQLTPIPDVAAGWQLSGAAAVDSWTAAGLFFAAKLQRELGVVIGVVSSSWGGTIAEAWTSRETLSRNPDFSKAMGEFELKMADPAYWDGLTEAELDFSPGDPERQESEQARFARVLPPEPANTGLELGWAQSSFDDSNWASAAMPARWKGFGVKTNGTMWYRRRVEIPASWENRELVLSLGGVDKHDITYFDGVEIGRTGEKYETACWDACRVYRIPARLVRPGVRILAVRDYSFAYDGGLIGPSQKMTLAPVDAEGESISLAGSWKYKIEADLGLAFPEFSAMGVGAPNTFASLFNNMIYPLIPMALRGVIWYQGESNESKPECYRRLMTDLIGDWRYHFAQGDFPFLQVALAGYHVAAEYDEYSVWAQIREAQLGAAIATGNLAASAVDVGDASDIHPKDKRTVGERLAQAALVQAYGVSGEGCGPVFRSMVRSGNNLLLSFDHAASGLVAKGGKLRGFWIAGKEAVFRPADAVIAGEQVAVSCERIPEPVSVRYAWSDNPEGANLYNGAGLPAFPFRADSEQ